MAVSSTAILALILASIVHFPAASASQWDGSRTVTQARMYISGALAIATLPAAYVPQAQVVIPNGITPGNSTSTSTDGETGTTSCLAACVRAV